MSKHTAAEVLAMSREFGDTVGHMLASYADLLAAQEKAVPVAVYKHDPKAMEYGVKWLIPHAIPHGTKLYTHPPVPPEGAGHD